MHRQSARGIGLLILLLFASTAWADWQGEIRSVGGLTRVINPETPARGEVTHELQELWRRGTDDEDIFFGVIGELLHDEQGNIYVLDSQLSEIQVFSPDGDHLRTLGRQGEGPGEFQNGADMFWGPGGELGVIQAWPGKIVMLTTDGDPGRTFPLPFREGGGFQSVSQAAGHEGNVILAGTAWTRVDGQQLQLAYLKAYDAEGQELASFQETSRETSFGGYEFIEEQYVDFQRRWALAPDGRVAAELDFAEYRIHIWNADGSLDRLIERPGYRPVKRTPAEKKRFQAMYDAFTRWNPNSTFRVSEVHQTVGQIFFRDDGTLWVQPSRSQWRTAEGVFTSFDVYDRKGRYLLQVSLAADADAVEDGLFFAGDRAYVVTDLFNALMARLGGDEGAEDNFEAEPVTVIAFEFLPVMAAAR